MEISLRMKQGRLIQKELCQLWPPQSKRSRPRFDLLPLPEIEFNSYIDIQLCFVFEGGGGLGAGQY